MLNAYCHSASTHLATASKFSGMPLKLNGKNFANKHNWLKNPNWWEQDQGRVGRKPVNADPRLKVHRGNDFSSKRSGVRRFCFLYVV